MNNDLMEKIVSLCKRRGFIYPASEIYGGFANAFDYGPLGSQMKKNIKDEWWRRFVVGRDDIVGLDSAIIQNPKVWEASGHLAAFTDPLVQCEACKKRFRQDQLGEYKVIDEFVSAVKSINYSDEYSYIEDLKKLVEDFKTKLPPFITANFDSFFNFDNPSETNNYHRLEQKRFRNAAEWAHSSADWVSAFAKNPNFTFACPECSFVNKGQLPRKFNLMFKTFVGVTEDAVAIAYLRPETAQGIFTNFQNVLQSTRVKLPFGIAQIGKAFRNEITPGNFIFRTREFEQAEIEYFIQPNQDESRRWYQIWLDEWQKFFFELGLNPKNLSVRAHAKEELSHYSSGTSDLEYAFPFGVSELAGVAQRTDYDLKQHMDHSGQDMRYFDESTGERYIPFVVEPTMGVDRAMLAFLVDAYDESDGSDGRAAGEVTLHLHPKIAPIKVGVFPLVKKEGLPEVAQKIATDLRQAGITTFYDESGSVGRRYRRQDEIGTPWCVTVDFDSLQNNTVTLRDRDTMQQERIKISEIPKMITDRLI